MTTKSKITSLLQIFSLIILAAGLSACDSTRDIRMLPPGGGNGQGDQKCDDKVNCKAAQDSKASRIGSLATQTAGWSEMILVAAMGEETEGTYSNCLTPELSEDGKELRFHSKANGIGCRKGNDFIKTRLTVDIERDSNDNVVEITTRPLASLAAEDTLGLDSHLEVTKSLEGQYSISTQLDLNIKINRVNAYTYSFEESVEMKSIRTPAPEMLESHSMSEFNINDFEYKGEISFKRNADGKLITELDLDTEKDDENFPTKAYVLNSTFETEESRTNRKPIDYKSEFKLYEEVDEVRISNCGVPTGRYHYLTKLSEKPSSEPASAWKSKAESKDYLDIQGTLVTAVIGKSSQRVTTCKNQLSGRLFSISGQIDMLFNEFHKNIGRRTTLQTVSPEKAADGTIQKTTGSSEVGEIRSARDGHCTVRNRAGKQQWIPNHNKNCN